jgi:flagellar motor switch protein FliG
MRPSGKQFIFVLLFVGFLGQAFAQSAVQIPPDIEAQARSLEAKFSSVLEQECPKSICTPVGCEVTSFRTLDEKQNSSLPGLDSSDEVIAGPLQYKLGSMRCEFAYEPSLANEALDSLRQRVADKVRIAGVSLNIQGRKLNSASPLFQKAEERAAAKTSEGLLRNWALSACLLILVATAAILTLIWAVRRLGKEKPKEIVTIDPEEVVEAKADPNELNVFALINKKDEVSKALASPDLATEALRPLIEKGDVVEICRVLKHFGPAPLAGFANQVEYRDLLSEVHKQYAEKAPVEDNNALAVFLDKLERLIALAQLGRPEAPVNSGLDFVRDLAPDEFTTLVSDLEHDEIMAVLSFVPQKLRSHYLQSVGGSEVEAYARHVLLYPRLSEQLMRRLAHKLKERFASQHSAIKRVGRGEVQQIEGLLNTLDSNKRATLLSQLRAESPSLFERVTSEVLLDRALIYAPENVLNELFLSLSPEEGAAYLQEQPDREKLLAKLKAPLSASISRRFAMNGFDFDEKENPLCQQARTKVNEVMREKSARGEISLKRINESFIKSAQLA